MLQIHTSKIKFFLWEILSWIGMPSGYLQQDMSIAESWAWMRQGREKTARKGLDTMFLLISWQLWKERNGRVFNNQFSTAQQLIR